MKNKIPNSILQAMKESDKPISSQENNSLAENEEIRYKLMDLTHDRKITMSNQLVFSSQPMTTMEARLLRIILSQVDSYRSDLEEDFVYTAKVKDLAKKLGCEGNKNVYKILETAGHSLRGRGFFLQNDDGDWIEISWFSYVKYLKGKGILEFKLNPDMGTFLTNLKNNFSYYSLDLLLSFKSRYSVRLYETIYSKVTRDTSKRHAYFNGDEVSIFFDIEEIRVVTATLHKYTGRINAFKSRVVEPAIKEINENSEMFITEYKTASRASNSTDTFEFILYQKEARRKGQFSEKQIKLLDCESVLDDNAELSVTYIKSLFREFAIGTPINQEEVSKLVQLYSTAKEFNDDFKTAFPKAKSDIVKYMLRMIENRRVQSKGQIIEGVIDNNAKISLSYVKRVYDAYGIDYDLDQLGEIYALFFGNTVGFNDHFLKNIVPKLKTIPNETLNKVAPETEEGFNEIIDYWNCCCFKIRMEIPDGVNIYLPKEVKRTTQNQKKYYVELIKGGETVESIKTAIDIAVCSQYFLRTQGRFGFFINPKNYYDIAAGERDYDTSEVNLWKMQRN